MKLTEVDFGAAEPIEGYGPDFFRIAGTAHDAPLLVAPGLAQPWGGYADMDRLLALRGQIDVLLIGTGAAMAPIPPTLRSALEEAGIGVEFMASATACRTYNVLLSEGRRIAAALLPAG